MFADSNGDTSRLIGLEKATHGLTITGCFEIAVASAILASEFANAFLPGDHDFAFILTCALVVLSCSTATVNIRAGLNILEAENWRKCAFWWNSVSAICHQLAFCAYIAEFVLMNYPSKYSGLLITLKIVAAESLFFMDCYILIILKKYVKKRAESALNGYVVLAHGELSICTEARNSEAGNLPQLNTNCGTRGYQTFEATYDIRGENNTVQPSAPPPPAYSVSGTH